VAKAGEILDNFPDAIVCSMPWMTTPGHMVLYVGIDDQSGEFYGYGASTTVFLPPDVVAGFNAVVYNEDGSFNTTDGGNLTGGDCDGFSIGDLYLSGQAFNFGGDGGVSTSTNSLSQDQTNLGTAFYIFLASFLGMVWLMRKH